MVKGDDALASKRNKAMRKKRQRKEGSLSARVASKKRRLSGIRRKCQGTKEAASLVEQIDSGSNPREKETEEALVNAARDEERQQTLRKAENLDCPSRFLTRCLNAIEESLRGQGVYYNNMEDGPLFTDAWGVEFLRCYMSGKDVLETSGVPTTSEQIAWTVSVAADTISRKEEKDLSVANPFLLYLVPFREKAIKVRNVCKPLKELGIHTVSLHSGASLDHQIQGLKSCEPEFLVSTPERLMELISRQAIDVSGVSFLVIDGITSLLGEGYSNKLKSIRQSISGNPFSVVFNDFLGSERPSALRNLLSGSVCRLTIDHSIRCQGACIVQTVDVCSSELEKLSKALSNACTNSLPSRPRKVLYVVGKDNKYSNIVKILKANGYSTSSAANSGIIEVTRLGHVISVMKEDNISSTDLGDYEIVVLPNFVQSMDDYIKILTRMARHSLNGVLHSVLTEEHAPLADSLIRTLAQCFQAVPNSLIRLCQRSSVGDYQSSPFPCSSLPCSPRFRLLQRPQEIITVGVDGNQEIWKARSNFVRLLGTAFIE